MIRKLLSTPTVQLGKAGRFMVFQIKLWSHCARLLKKNRSGQQAAALSYNTIFGLIPLAIVALLVFETFPASSDVGDKIKNFIYEELHLSNISYPAGNKENSQETIVLTEYLDNIVEGFFTGMHKGTITIISVIIVVWAAIALLSTIERSFNMIWHVSKGRGFLHRVINYWGVMTLGSMLMGLGIFIIAKYAILSNLKETVLTILGPLFFSYFITTLIFFLLYFILPNTKVNAKPAIWGAAMASLVWIAEKEAFGYYVREVKPFNSVYGAMGMIPLFIFWIYLSWLTVLFGLQLTYTTQNLKTLDAAEIAAAKKTEGCFIANDITAINIIREVAKAFEQNHAPIEPNQICSKLKIPAEFAEKIFTVLVNKNLLIKSSEPKTGYVPAKATKNIILSDIAQAIDLACFAQVTNDYSAELDQISQLKKEMFSKYNLQQLLDIDEPPQTQNENQQA